MSYLAWVDEFPDMEFGSILIRSLSGRKFVISTFSKSNFSCAVWWVYFIMNFKPTTGSGVISKQIFPPTLIGTIREPL